MLVIMPLRKPIRIALWVAGSVALLILVVVLAVWLRLDAYAKSTVETSATNSFGLPTATDRVHVSVFSGDIGVAKFRVANVEGYEPERVMSVDDIDVGVELGSLWEETLRVPQVEMKNFRLFIQRKGLTTNVSQMLAKMRQRADEQPAEPGRKLLIDRVLIRNVVAQVDLGTGKPVEVTIPELLLEEVTRDNANAVAAEEVMRRIFPAIVSAVLEQGQGVLPADLIGSIRGDLNEAVAAMGGDAQRLVRQAADDLLGGALKGIPAGDVPSSGSGPVSDKVEGAADRLRDVFGGQKKDGK